jgi:hypothetical protein
VHHADADAHADGHDADRHADPDGYPDADPDGPDTDRHAHADPHADRLPVAVLLRWRCAAISTLRLRR